MNFLFWNIKKKTSDDFMMHVVNLLNENCIAPISIIPCGDYGVIPEKVTHRGVSISVTPDVTYPCSGIF